MENLRRLLGDDWIKQELLRANPEHPLGRWYKKSPDSSVIRYTEELADFVLNSGTVKCDRSRLASKLKGEFVDTLVELGYTVFLARRGSTVTMVEPMRGATGSLTSTLIRRIHVAAQFPETKTWNTSTAIP